jgi:integrase
MHDARHTYATDLGRATNWNIVAVQKNLGHKSIQTTMDIYTHFAFDDQLEAVQALPEIGGE